MLCGGFRCFHMGTQALRRNITGVSCLEYGYSKKNIHRVPIFKRRFIMSPPLGKPVWLRGGPFRPHKSMYNRVPAALKLTIRRGVAFAARNFKMAPLVRLYPRPQASVRGTPPLTKSGAKNKPMSWISVKKKPPRRNAKIANARRWRENYRFPEIGGRPAVFSRFAGLGILNAITAVLRI